jgi:Protein of unknown function (DUF3105)
MQRRKVYLGAGGVAAVVIVVAAVLVLAGGGGTSFASLVKSNTCTVKSFPDEGQGHTYKGKLILPTDVVPYKTDPATSGHHYQVPAPWGVYTEPIPAVIRVHNLEHGGIEVLYGDKVSEADRTQIEKDVRSDWKLMLMAPYPKLGDKVYYVAWQHWIACTGYQKGALDEAQKRWRDKGPESPFDPTVNKQPDFGS